MIGIDQDMVKQARAQRDREIGLLVLSFCPREVLKSMGDEIDAALAQDDKALDAQNKRDMAELQQWIAEEQAKQR